MQARIMIGDWDWNGAEREFKRAFELSSNLSEAHLRYASLLSRLGRHDEAIASTKRAQDVDPLDLRARNGEGISLYFARRYDEAIQKFESVLKIAPDNDIALVYRAYTYAAKEMYNEAISEYQKLVAAGDNTTSTQCYIGYALARSGKKAEAQAIQEKLKTTKDYLSPAEFAILYLALGDNDGAFGLLERAYAAHDLQMQYLKVDPHYDSLRSDPRFVNLLKKVGLPQ